MKLIVAATLLCVSAGSAAAIERYDIQNLTCNQVHGILDQQGAAILRYPAPSGSGRILYDRYVREPIICAGEGNHAIQRTVPVRDTNACPTYSCKPGPPECDDGIFSFGLFGCLDSD